MTGMAQDVRLALRGFRKSPSFAAVALLTLAVGIGASTAIFAIVDAVLLRPIVADQERVVRVWKRDRVGDQQRLFISYPEFRAWRDQAKSFEGLAAINYADTLSTAITVGDRTSAVILAPVSIEFFDVLRAGTPLHGRLFQRSDELPGAAQVVVVSERFWRQAAGGAPEFVGRQLVAAGGGRSLTVVGIAPAGFEYPLGTDMWVPIPSFFGAGGMGGSDSNELNQQIESPQFAHFELLGRLVPGATPQAAQAELDILCRRFGETYPHDQNRTDPAVEPLLSTVLGSSDQVLRFLSAGAALVFVIAGVNVAMLLLMRSETRRTELAVRTALGASRGRLLRQQIVESMLLAVGGVVLATGIATLALWTAQWLAGPDIPRLGDAEIGWRVLIFSMVIAAVWALIFGTAPIWSASRAAPDPATLRSSFRAVRATGSLRMFTVAEIAAAVIIAIGAGLLLRSFINLQRIERGFQTHNLIVTTLLLPEAEYPNARTKLQFFKELIARVESISGVAAGSTIHMSPGSATVGLSAKMVFEGQTPAESALNPWMTWEPTLPSHFRTLEIPVLQGRAFSAADDSNAAPVVIVTQAVANRYWPGQNPIGKRLKLANSEKFPWTTVVGVVGDTRYRELTKPWMTAYFPGEQFFFFQPKLVVRTAGDPERIIPMIAQTIRAQEPDAAIEWSETMDSLLARGLSRQRTALGVSVGFSMVALLLAAVGVYGVLSYDVRARRQELALRSALGAEPARLFRTVVVRSLALGGAGAVAGVLVAAALTRTVRSLLYEVAPLDVGVFAAGAGVLLAIVLIASSIPARRAAQVDPVAALKYE